jgi:hypothetical protein
VTAAGRHSRDFKLGVSHEWRALTATSIISGWHPTLAEADYQYRLSTRTGVCDPATRHQVASFATAFSYSHSCAFYGIGLADLQPQHVDIGTADRALYLPACRRSALARARECESSRGLRRRGSRPWAWDESRGLSRGAGRAWRSSRVRLRSKHARSVDEQRTIWAHMALRTRSVQ